MTIASKSWQQFTQDMIATWGKGIGITPVLDAGDFLLAIFEAASSQMEFLQAQVFMVLKLTRAVTSSGADLDTWMAQFAFTRLQSTFATGPVILGKIQPSSSPIFVPAATLVARVYTGGSLVQTPGGGTTFRIIPDLTEASYDLQSNSYKLSAGASSMQVTVQATIGGSAGNVAAGAISQLASGIPMDTVSNTTPLANGFDAESDDSFRARFVLYLSTLAKATKAAILAAAQGVQQGVAISLAENQLPDGSAERGVFTVFVDDGGSPPTDSLLASIYAAVDTTRAFCIQPYVVASKTQAATVSMSVRLAAGYSLVTVQPLVTAAVVAVADGLTAGQTLFISSISTAALSITGVVAVAPGVLINGVNADFTPDSVTQVQLIIGSVLVTEY